MADVPEKDEKGRFTKGNAGGPGRPKGKVSFTTELRRHLEANPKDVEAVVKKTVLDAKKGVESARKLVWERIDGAVPQRISIGQLTTEQLLDIAQAGGIDGVGEEGDSHPEPGDDASSS